MTHSSPICEHCEIRSSNPLQLCPLHELELINEAKTCTSYKTGQVIFHERSMAVGLFCVFKGKIKLHKMGSDGKEQITRLVKPGDFIGYRALMSETPYSASATALEDSVTCFIPRNTFFKILKENGSVADGMIKLLCKNLEDSEKRLTEMAYKPVRERLAEAMLVIKHTFQEADQENENFSFTMTREDLAGFVGTAKETVIRLLSEMKKNGIVKSEGRKITLLDCKRLAEISNMYD